MLVSVPQEWLDDTPGFRDAKPAKAGKGNCTDPWVFVAQGMGQRSNALNAPEFAQSSRCKGPDGRVRVVYGLRKKYYSEIHKFPFTHAAA